jgi:hypothetical protein
MTIREGTSCCQSFPDEKIIGSRIEVTVDSSGSMLEAEELIFAGGQRGSRRGSPEFEEHVAEDL